MRIIETELSGVLEEEEIPLFGGNYTIWEKLKMGGTGSPKVIYQSGIPAFDELVKGAENESTFVSFEVMKNGLIVRANRQQRLHCVGARLTDIDIIKLEAFKIRLRFRRAVGYIYRTTFRGELIIQEKDGQPSSFIVSPQNMPGVLAFFQKKQLVDKLDYFIHETQVEKGYFSFKDDEL